MMRASAPVAFAIVFALNVTPAYAQRGSSGHSTAPKSPTTHGPTSQATHGAAAKPSTPKASGSHGSSHAGPKSSTTPSNPKAGGVKAGASKTDRKGSTTTSTSTSTSATTASSNGSTTELTPVQLKLQKNTNLASKLQDRLPKGTNLMDAAVDFRNLGQFVAAVNVSHNLHIDFAQLKADMVTKKMSLGQAIHDLKPAASATVEAQHAEFEANLLIAQTESTTTTTTTTTTSTTPTTKKKTPGQ